MFNNLIIIMKRYLAFWILLLSIIVSWCTLKSSYVDTESGTSYYGWTLVVAGVWPEISGNPTAEDGTLVLRWYFEDHTDHIFLQSWIRQDYFKAEKEYLPLNKLKFEWDVEFIDGAAWNHYYNVKNVYKLKIHEYPDVDEIMDFVDLNNYCESDDDCELMAGECPFWCFLAVNKKYVDLIWEIMYNYFETSQWPKCVYDCLYVEWTICENNKCIFKE
jgi:hypothetical protein